MYNILYQFLFKITLQYKSNQLFKKCIVQLLFQDYWVKLQTATMSKPNSTNQKNNNGTPSNPPPRRNSYTKDVVEYIRDTSMVITAGSLTVTAIIPNPVTAATTAVSGVVTAVTGLIARRID